MAIHQSDARAALGALVLSGAAFVSSAAPAFAIASPADQAFVTAAAQGGMAEVADATLALTNSTDPTVLAFAKKMIADHSKANKKLAAIAKGDDYTLPSNLDSDNTQEKGALQKLKGKTFDTLYIKGQEQGHEKMEQVMRSEIATGKNPALVAFAKATLPTVEEHLSLAKSDSMKVTSTTAGGAKSGAAPGGDMSTPAAAPAPMATQT